MDKLESSKTLQFGLHQECSVGEGYVMFGLKDGSSVVVPVLLFFVRPVSELWSRTCIFLYFQLLCLLTV